MSGRSRVSTFGLQAAARLLSAGLALLAVPGCLSLDEQVASLTPGARDDDGDPFEHDDRVDAIADLVEGLEDADDEVLARREAIAGGLRASLDDPSPLIRGSTVMALGKFVGAGAAGPIADRLRDQDRWVRMQAARTLGEIATEEARAPLELALARDPDAMVRREAAAGLASIGSQASRRPLYLGLGDAAPAVRFACARSLHLLTGQDLGEDPRAWRGVVEQ